MFNLLYSRYKTGIYLQHGFVYHHNAAIIVLLYCNATKFWVCFTFAEFVDAYKIAWKWLLVG